MESYVQNKIKIYKMQDSVLTYMSQVKTNNNNNNKRKLH